MRNKRQLSIHQLDEKIASLQTSQEVVVPERGWINAIRTGVNMTLAQLGEKLNMTRQGVRNLEQSEAMGKASLNSLKEVANAMDLKLVYGFVPKDGTFENLIAKKSKELAKKIVLRTNQNMVLEDQGIGYQKINDYIEDLANEIKSEVRRSIWD